MDLPITHTDEEALPVVLGVDRLAEETSREAACLHKAYDDKKCKGALRKRSINSRIARKGIESSEKLGVPCGLPRTCCCM
jgi:hypothetical protein